MIKDNDTICALSTVQGEGGIGIIKISGKDSLKILKAIFRDKKNKKISKIIPWRLNYGYIINSKTGEIIDEVLVSYMQKPKTYTREDIVEINSHGGPLLTEKILKLVLRNGARLAEPGEFTRRAFLSGRIDLLEAEAVCELVKSKSEVSLRRAHSQLSGKLSKKINELKNEILETIAALEANIDFSDQDIPAISKTKLKMKLSKIQKNIEILLKSARYDRIYREGVNIVLVGLPNVGKSSLFNALLEEQKAIVTHIPGTTRDILEETIVFKGLALKFTDTAGITLSDDKISKEAAKKSKKAITDADLIILIYDLEKPKTLNNFFKNIKKEIKKEINEKPLIIVGNKLDLIKGKKNIVNDNIYGKPILISAQKEQGIKQLEEKIKSLILKGKIKSEPHLVVNLRHKALLEKSLTEIKNAKASFQKNLSEDLIIINLNEALSYLLEITGENLIEGQEQVLDKIFENFCIGK